MRPEPTPAVAAWIAERNAGDMFLTAISEAELRYGVAIVPAGRRKSELEGAMTRWLDEGLVERILPFHVISEHLIDSRFVEHILRGGGEHSIKPGLPPRAKSGSRMARWPPRRAGRAVRPVGSAALLRPATRPSAGAGDAVRCTSNLTTPMISPSDLPIVAWHLPALCMTMSFIRRDSFGLGWTRGTDRDMRTRRRCASADSLYDTASPYTSSQPWNTMIRPMKRTPGNCRARRSSAR